MSTRYKAKTITPVDVVIWNGENFAEVQALCPAVEKHGTMLIIPTDLGPAEVYVGQVVMRNIGTAEFSKMGMDVFCGLYEPQ
jgi:hypothetical protein